MYYVFGASASRPKIPSGLNSGAQLGAPVGASVRGVELPSLPMVLLSDRVPDFHLLAGFILLAMPALSFRQLYGD